MKELKLSEIWIYPVKSLGGIRLPSAKVLEKGLQHDRRFMLIDDEGKFITQRVHARMALFKLAIAGDNMVVRHSNESITIPLAPPVQQPSLHVQIWDDTVEANEVDTTISHWFSKHLQISCKLVYFPEQNSRAVDEQYHVNHEHVSLADAYPFLVIGQSSLDDLNSRMQTPLPMNRFRPNLVFTGGELFEEDHWRNFTVGTNGFIGVKPCARCVLTTVNQDTAEKGAEPLKTLAKYRSRNNKIYFGQNLVAVHHKEISEGDTIVLES